MDFRRALITVSDTIINYEIVFALYFLMVKYSNDVVNATSLISNLLTRENLAPVADYYRAQMDVVGEGGEALSGIKCSDSFMRSYNMEDFMTEIEYMKEMSNLFWPTAVMYLMHCAQWPFEDKERYSGELNVKMRPPILFIGSTYDAATPAASAQNMSAYFQPVGC